jgi:hypothetical protein
LARPPPGPRSRCELEAELLVKLVAPLLDEAARGDDHHPPDVGAHDQFADVEAGHDGLAGARVAGEDETQRLSRQQGLVDGRDLVRERLHVGRVDGHHGVEQKGQVEALGLACKLERRSVAVKRPGAIQDGDGDGPLIGGGEETFLECPVGELVEDLHSALGDGHDGDHRADALRFEADEGVATL